MGDLKVYYLPAHLYQYFDDKQRCKDDIFEMNEYKICRILYNIENSEGSNDDILSEINWDFVFSPRGYIDNNLWVHQKRE